jgi:hypothetical protein
MNINIALSWMYKIKFCWFEKYILMSKFQISLQQKSSYLELMEHSLKISNFALNFLTYANED